MSYKHASFITLLQSTPSDQNVGVLWQWTNCRIQTKADASHPVVVGTLFGPWNLTHEFATTDATSAGRVVMYAHWPSDGPVNQNFTIELNPPAAHMP